MSLVLASRADGVATLSLNRPDRGNALGPELVEALAERGVTAYGRTGINVWVPVPDETVAVTTLRDAGWALAPGGLYRIAADPAVRVSVSALDEADIPALADALTAGRKGPLLTHSV